MRNADEAALVAGIALETAHSVALALLGCHGDVDAALLLLTEQIADQPTGLPDPAEIAANALRAARDDLARALDEAAIDVDAEEA